MDSLQRRYRTYLWRCALASVESFIDHQLLSFEEFCQLHLETKAESCYNADIHEISGGEVVAAE